MFAPALSGAVDTAFVGTENRRAKIHSQKLVPELTLEACLPTVNQAVKCVARRHHLSDDEADDLRGEVCVRIIERNVLGQFRREAGLFTFLKMVVTNVLNDLRDKAWQKWRPSIDAKRLGSTAMLLERLMVRDGYSLDHACEIMRTNHRVAESEAELATLHEKLPHRTRRRWVGEEAMESLPAAGVDADLEVLKTEQDYLATRIGAALERALAGLPDEDVVVIKMRFYDGLKVSEISRLLGLEQKGLYPRIERLLDRLHETLVAAGFPDGEVSALLKDVHVEIAPVLGKAARPRDPRGLVT